MANHQIRVQREIEELRCVMELIDSDGSGYLSLNEFLPALKNQRIQHALRDVGVDIKMPELYFKTLALVTNQEEVSVDDFVKHIVQMKGHATSVDVQSLTLETAVLKKNVADILESQSSILKALRQ